MLDTSTKPLFNRGFAYIREHFGGVSYYGDGIITKERQSSLRFNPFQPLAHIQKLPAGLQIGSLRSQDTRWHD